MRACVEAIAAPDWLPTVIEVADWSRRYGARVDTWRLPTSQTKRAELVAAYGTDALVLLHAVNHTGAPAWLRELPAVDVLRRVLVQNYVITTVITRDAAGREVIRAREAETDGLPPGHLRLSSPYDLDARWAAKGDDLYWNGYRVHVTETCEDPLADGGHPDGNPNGGQDRQRLDVERPNIIVGVATTDATVPDARMTENIHAALAARDLLPAEHFVDSGYPSAALLVDSLRRWGVTLVSPLPTRPDLHLVEPCHPARHRRDRDQVRGRYLPTLPGT